MTLSNDETPKPALSAFDIETAAESSAPHATHFWLWVMCLTGVDYFSTLGYQPSIAFNAAGFLSPVATLVLVLVTLFCALPVYRYVAEHSSHGQGSIGMLQQLVSGWPGKLLVLILIGFAATDFIITKTLSAADAAEHLIHNGFYKEHTPGWMHHQFGATSFLLVLLGGTFMRGFKEVIGIAVVLVGVYLVLNIIIIGGGISYLASHVELLEDWRRQVLAGDWHASDLPLQGSTGIFAAIATSVLIFPKLALGLSGYETGVSVMPLVRGDATDTEETPRGRIRNTGKLLGTAALLMSVLLIGSSLVTTTLIDPIAYKTVEPGETPDDPRQGKANNRALAYLAHGDRCEKLADPISPIFGPLFGTIYDISTILILWFAGASAMAGLLNLVPKYLPRFGMAPEWARAIRPLVLLFTTISLFVTWVFDANVEAQGSAYATGVLVLMSSAAVGVVVDVYRKGSGMWLTRMPWGYATAAVVFLFSTITVIIEKPAGMKIAACFITAVLVVSFASRAWRSRELRFGGFQFVDESSRLIWDDLKAYGFPILIPHRPGNRSLAEKEASIRREHRLTEKDPVVFIEADLGDVSNFTQRPLLSVSEQAGSRIVLKADKCASVPHVIAAIALEMSKSGKPPEIHFGWSDESPLAASLSFILFGQGNVPWMVRELIRRYEPDPAKQPRVVVG